jgi:mRNA interferase MazF
VRRGELWTLAGGSDFAGRPRPSVIVQSDLFGTLESVTACFITSTRPEALQSLVRKDRLGTRIGTFSDDDMTEVEAALLVFLGIKSDASLSTR